MAGLKIRAIDKCDWKPAFPYFHAWLLDSPSSDYCSKDSAGPMQWAMVSISRIYNGWNG